MPKSCTHAHTIIKCYSKDSVQYFYWVHYNGVGTIFKRNCSTSHRSLYSNANNDCTWSILPLCIERVIVHCCKFTTLREGFFSFYLFQNMFPSLLERAPTEFGYTVVAEYQCGANPPRWATGKMIILYYINFEHVFWVGTMVHISKPTIFGLMKIDVKSASFRYARENTNNIVNHDNIMLRTYYVDITAVFQRWHYVTWCI